MRLSVVIIVFNLEDYVGQALDSVLAQTRPADEIIVVDDCSADGSAAVVEARGDRVRYLRMPQNSGALLTALHGVKAATGDIVCMLDGDDYWAPNKLAVVEREFLADPALILLSHDHVRVDENGRALPVRDDTHRNIASIRRRARSADQLSGMLREAILQQTGYWLGSAYSFRRDCLDVARFEAQIAPFGSERLRQAYLDLVIAPFLVLTNPVGRVGYAPDTTLFYRIHGKGSMAQSATPEDARRAALKGRAIHALINIILRENQAHPAHLRRRAAIIEHYDYLSALYAGEFGHAGRLYQRLARRHWSWRELRNETLRLVAVGLLGPRRFLNAKRSAASASREPVAGPRPLAKVCYLSVDGMTDPLGRSQVLPYLTGLAARGHQIRLVSMEKPDRLATQGAKVRAICQDTGIGWTPLAYGRRPPILAGWWNIMGLARVARRLHRQEQFDIVHGRSDLSSLAGRSLWRGGGARFLYDMRALWPDERVDGGAWPQSSPVFRAIYRKFKRHQNEFITAADAIVCLTRDARALLEEWPGRHGAVTVIPCAADFELFSLPSPARRRAARVALGLTAKDKALVYLGSIGSWYMLEEMLEFFAAYRARHGSARFLVVTPDPPGPILEAAEARGLASSLLVRSATREEVPGLLAACDAGLFFIRPVPSKRASCPTKLGEMLASGLPVIANAGVGDVAEVLRETGGGVVVERFDREAYDAALDALDELGRDPRAIRRKAKAWFDIEIGIAAYDGVYRQLLAEGGTR